MTRHEQELLQMNFEQILGFVSDAPKRLLSGGALPRSLHAELKVGTSQVRHLRFTLDLLEKEFLDQLQAAGSQKR